LDDDPAERIALAEDERFFGVFEYLANSLPATAARELRDYLVSAAVDRKDHRLSDRFIMHLRWRRLVAEADPDWLASYDMPHAKELLAAFDALELERTELESQMKSLRPRIDAARASVRMLTAADDDALEKAVVAALVEAGAKQLTELDPGTAAPRLAMPDGFVFTMVAAAGARLAMPSGRHVLGLTLARLEGPVLLVVNTEPYEPPAQRDRELIQTIKASFAARGTVVLDALTLLEKLTAARNEASYGVLWSAWDATWREPAPTAA
jgi:hypothetical protein